MRKERLLFPELLRILASFFVVLIHVFYVTLFFRLLKLDLFQQCRSLAYREAPLAFFCCLR